MLLDRALTDAHRTGRQPVLRTARLVLRAPSFDDARLIAILAGDRRVAENTAQIPNPYGIEDAKKWIVDAVAQPATYVITVSGEIVGVCSLNVRDEIPEVGYWIGVPFWGRGYATEATHRLVDCAFHELGYSALKASARISNPVSRRVLEKCGFKWTGVGLRRIRALSTSVPVDRFLLERKPS
jgi:RimJ/RimL family protein N-acetyltransferase